jgi:hypothetical protein
MIAASAGVKVMVATRPVDFRKGAARHLRYDHARRIRLRHDPPLDLVAPSAATSHTDLDIHPAPRLRGVNYMVNHICEPYCM